MTDSSFLFIAMPFLLIPLKVGLWIFGVVFVFNGLSDLFLDAVKIGRDLWRSVVVFGWRKAKPLTEEDLLSTPEKPIAIMIPCWDESAVIRRMLENTLKVVNYSNYVIFVGTYPNDPDTHREVELAREQYRNIERIVCPKDGPTSKSDCLNWIYEGIRHYEKTHGLSFEVIVMEDSEDVVHPLTLKLFNYLIPRMDMVQLPVIPMEARWYEFTRGTYLDEFAINHSRDIVVREILSKNLPSAGVGTALSSSLLQRLYKENNHQLFTIGSVTEDYDFGIRLGSMKNIRQVFSKVGFEQSQPRVNFFTGRETLVKKRDYIGIREFFPNTFRTAVRQKSRWVLGITLQAWETIGWVGGFWMRYMLFRDRIGLLTNQVTMLANLLVPIYLVVWGYVYFFPEAYRYPPLVERGTVLYYILLFNLGVLVWQISIRFYYVRQNYGLKQAMLSPLRLVWANVINYCATVRALKIYVRHRIHGTPVAWDKTDHAYPTEDELVRFRRRLGDLLLDRRFLTVAQLDMALERQKQTGLPLGYLLVDMGFLEEDKLLQVLGVQLSLQTAEIDPSAQNQELLALIPKQHALNYQVYPLSIDESGKLVVGVANPPKPEVINDIENCAGRKIQLRLISRGQLSYALRRKHEQSQGNRNQNHLGQELIQRGLVSEKQLQQALCRQRSSYRNIGDLLVFRGCLTQAERDGFVDSQKCHNSTLAFGEQLVMSGLITREQLESTLEEQKKAMPLLGEELIAAGYVKSGVIDAVLMDLGSIRKSESGVAT